MTDPLPTELALTQHSCHKPENRYTRHQKTRGTGGLDTKRNNPTGNSPLEQAYLTFPEEGVSIQPSLINGEALARGGHSEAFEAICVGEHLKIQVEGRPRTPPDTHSARPDHHGLYPTGPEEVPCRPEGIQEVIFCETRHRLSPWLVATA